MTTKIEIATANVNTARANLAELQAARRAAAASLESIEAQIGAGAGIETPALFGARRDRVDLLAWLDEKIADAAAAHALAEQRLTELTDKARAARAELDSVMARSVQNTSAAAEMLAQAARVGDAAAALVLVETRQSILEAEAARLMEILEELGELP